MGGTCTGAVLTKFGLFSARGGVARVEGVGTEFALNESAGGAGLLAGCQVVDAEFCANDCTSTD